MVKLTLTVLTAALPVAFAQQSPTELACSASSVTVAQVNRWCEVENVPTVPVQASSCCNPTLDQLDDEDSRDNEGCRAVETSAAYCPLSGCDLTANNQLEIGVLMSNTDTQGVCCDTCYCVGDPLCGLWREGELKKDIFVSCDGRIRSGKNACKMNKNICNRQRDHLGRSCKWKQGGWKNMLEDGSPCQADKSLPSARMAMYSVRKGNAEYHLDLTLGERGVIKDITYTRIVDGMPSSMKLNSDLCFDYNPRKIHVQESGKELDGSSISSTVLSGDAVVFAKQAWEFSEGMEKYVSAVTMPNMVETQFTVVDPDSGLEFDIRCTSPKAAPEAWTVENVQEWQASSTRLDVPVALLPRQSADTPGTSEGFCSQGTISLLPDQGQDIRRLVAQTTSSSDYIEFHDMCFNKWVPDYVEACQQIVTSSCNPVNYAGYAEQWCTECSNTFPDSAEACIEKLTNTKRYKAAEIAAHWREYIVEMNSKGAGENAIALLEADISMFSYEHLFSRGYVGDIRSCAGISSREKVCGTINDYGPRKSECERGVSVEYYDDCATVPGWREAFFIPASLPPCDNVIRVTGDMVEHRNLFKHKLRMSQCNLSPSCLRENRCAATPGFAVSFDFSMAGFPPKCVAEEEVCAHTTTPTKNPTASPVVPSTAPTTSPVVATPTSAPTTSPVVPTPTSAPTSSPLESPPPKAWTSSAAWTINNVTTGYAVIDREGDIEFALARHDLNTYETLQAKVRKPYDGLSGGLCNSSVGEGVVLVSAKLSSNKDDSPSVPVVHVWNVTSRHVVSSLTFTDLELVTLETLECGKGVVFLGGVDNENKEVTRVINLESSEGTARRVLQAECTDKTDENSCKYTFGCAWESERSGLCSKANCEAFKESRQCEQVPYCFWNVVSRTCKVVTNSFKMISCETLPGSFPQLAGPRRLVTFTRGRGTTVLKFFESKELATGECTTSWNNDVGSSVLSFPFVSARVDAMAKGNLYDSPKLVIVRPQSGSLSFDSYTIDWKAAKLRSNVGRTLFSESGLVRSLTTYDYIIQNDAIHYLALGFNEPRKSGLAYELAVSRSTGEGVSVTPKQSHDGNVDNLFFQGTNNRINLYLSGANGLQVNRRRLDQTIAYVSSSVIPGKITELQLVSQNLPNENTTVIIDEPPRPHVDIVKFPWNGDKCEFVDNLSPTTPECLDNDPNWPMRLSGSTAQCKGSCSIQVQDIPIIDQAIATIHYPFAWNVSQADLVAAQASARFSFYVGNATSCCRTCSCWGDPECTSFGKTRKEKLKWVVCDARSIENGCSLEKDLCTATVDHKNRDCVWDPELAKKKKKDVQIFGSPCQSNWSTSGLAGMTMYKTSFLGQELSVGLQMGERGIIERLMVRYEDGNGQRTALDLFASKCFGSGPIGELPGIQSHGLPVGWNYTRANGAGTSASFLQDTVDGKEQTFVMDRIRLKSFTMKELEQHFTLDFGAVDDRKITLDVSCSRKYAISKKGLLGGERLTVDIRDSALFAPYKDSEDGFCHWDKFEGHNPVSFDPWAADNSILAMSDIPQVETPEVTEACEDNTPEVIVTCTGITGANCEAYSAPDHARAWCATQANPTHCVSAIFDSNGKLLTNQWIEEYCHAISNCLEGMGSNVKTCKHDLINDLNPAERFENFNDECRLDSQATCASSVFEYSKEPATPCTHGVFVQSSSDGLTWDTAFFVPDDFLPCGEDNTLVVGAADFPELFSAYVRFVRKDIDFETCKRKDANKACLARPEFRVDYDYRANVCMQPSTQAQGLFFPPYQSQVSSVLLE